MSRNKKCLPALLLLLSLALSSAGAESLSDSLISDDFIEAATVNYRTQKVVLGDMARETSFNGVEYYPHTYQLACETPNAKFVEYKVKRGSEVKAGDVLAVFSVEEDQVSMASLQMSLEQKKAAFQKGKETRLENLDALQEKITLSTDREEQKMLSLQLAYDQIALEQYIYQQTIAIEKVEESIRELEEKWADNVMIAPADGVITSIVHLRAGDYVGVGAVLIEMYRTDDMLIRVSNDGGTLHYGMEVEVSIGRNQKQKTLKGTVVGADTLLSKGMKTGAAYIQVEPFNRDDVVFTNIRVKVKCSVMKQVISLPRSEPTLDGGKYYITMLEDGVAKKRFVQCFFSSNNPTQAWIVQGLEEGDILIID